MQATVSNGSPEHDGKTFTLTASGKVPSTKFASIFGSKDGIDFFALNDRASGSVRKTLADGKELTNEVAKHQKKIRELHAKCDQLTEELEEFENDQGKAEKLAELTAEQLTLKSLKSVRHYTLVLRFHVVSLLSGLWAVGSGVPVLLSYTQELCGDYETCIRLVIVQVILMVLLGFVATRRVNRKFLPLQFKLPGLNLPSASRITRTKVRWERVDQKIVFVQLQAVKGKMGYVPLRPRKARCDTCSGQTCSKCQDLITDCASCSGKGCEQCCRLVPEIDIQREYIKFLQVLTAKKKYTGVIPRECEVSDMDKALEIAADEYATNCIQAYEDYIPRLEFFVSSTIEMHKAYVQYIERRLWWITFWERLLFVMATLLSLALLLTFPLALAFKVLCKGTYLGYGCGLVGFGMGSIVFTLTIVVSRKNFVYAGDKVFVETVYTREEVETRGFALVVERLGVRKDDELDVLESQPQAQTHQNQ